MLVAARGTCHVSWVVAPQPTELLPPRTGRLLGGNVVGLPLAAVESARHANLPMGGHEISPRMVSWKSPRTSFVAPARAQRTGR